MKVFVYDHPHHNHFSYCSATVSDADGFQQVFVVCFNGDEYGASVTFFLMKGVMMLISVFFLAITLYIYYLIPDLRETQDRVTSIAVASLMLFMLLLGLVQLGSSSFIHGIVCEFIGKLSVVRGPSLNCSYIECI